jgi:sugar phosphate isomerase/epimerase
VTARLFATTTSHKREALLPTLDVFARLGFRDLDLNLHHFMERAQSVDAVAVAVASCRQRVWAVSGGWCDFFHTAPQVDDTFRSVARQVQIAERLGVAMLRLFFGRLPPEAFDRAAADAVVGNLVRLSDRHPEITFVFENHDGVSLVPELCREVLERVDRPNIRMMFDPINFARVGVDPVAALAAVRPFVDHVHLKGLDRGEYCAFGTGDCDLTPCLQDLWAGGYRGAFSVEYEGPGDGTVQLYESIARAQAVIATLGGV